LASDSKQEKPDSCCCCCWRSKRKHMQTHSEWCQWYNYWLIMNGLSYLIHWLIFFQDDGLGSFSPVSPMTLCNNNVKLSLRCPGCRGSRRTA
jgi:uncharacterized membrane protein